MQSCKWVENNVTLTQNRTAIVNRAILFLGKWFRTSAVIKLNLGTVLFLSFFYLFFNGRDMCSPLSMIWLISFSIVVLMCLNTSSRKFTNTSTLSVGFHAHSPFDWLNGGMSICGVLTMVLNMRTIIIFLAVILSKIRSLLRYS